MATVAIATLVVGAAVPAQAAYPTSSYHVVYGQSYSKGTLTWYARGVNYDGEAKAVAGTCRTTRLETLYADGSLITKYSNPGGCTVGPDSMSFDVKDTAPADVPGGAAWVRLCLMGKAFPSSDPWSTLSCANYQHP